MVMMTVKEYADKMASSASYIRQMCAEGIIPSVKIGKAYKIDVEKADEYFRKRIEERMTEKPKKQVVKVAKPTKGADFVKKLKEMRANIKYEQEQMC